MLEHEPLYFSAFHPWSLSLMMIPSIFPKPNLHIATRPSFVLPGTEPSKLLACWNFLCHSRSVLKSLLWGSLFLSPNYMKWGQKANLKEEMQLYIPLSSSFVIRNNLVSLQVWPWWDDVRELSSLNMKLVRILACSVLTPEKKEKG